MRRAPPASPDRSGSMRDFLLSGNGRLDRLGYLTALLVDALLFCLPIAFIVPTELKRGLRPLSPDIYDGAVLMAGTVIWVLVLWVYCATTARRLHDLGRSGWLAVLALIPAVGLGALTVALLVMAGVKGDNRYGPRWL